MNELRSLADQLREEIATPKDGKSKNTKARTTPKKDSATKNKRLFQSPIIEEISAYDNKNHNHMVHVRFSASTSILLNQFKIATNVDVTKLVAFAVHLLFKEHPELKSIIKQSIQNLEL